jgi:hypothetical protein
MWRKWIVSVLAGSVALGVTACGNAATDDDQSSAGESAIAATTTTTQPPDATGTLRARALDFESAMKAGDTVTVAGFIAGPNCVGDDRAGYLAAFGNGPLLAAQTADMHLLDVTVDGEVGYTRYGGLPDTADEYDWRLINNRLWVIDC